MADKEYNGYIKSVRDSNGNVYATHDPRVDDKDFLRKDWNENDKESTTYIENRTHYEEITKYNRTELLDSSWKGNLETSNAPAIILENKENDTFSNSTIKTYKISDSLDDISSSIENAIIYFKAGLFIPSSYSVEVENIGTLKEGITIMLDKWEEADKTVESNFTEEDWRQIKEGVLSKIKIFNQDDSGFCYGFDPSDFIKDETIRDDISPTFNYIQIEYVVEDYTSESGKKISKGTYCKYIDRNTYYDKDKTKLSNKSITALISLDSEGISIKQLDKKYIQDIYDKFDSSIQNLEKTKMNIANPKGTGNFTITDGYAIFQNGAYQGTTVNPDNDSNKFITKGEVKEQVDKAVTLTDDQTIKGKKYFEDGLYSGQIKDTNGNYIEVKDYIDSGDDKAVKLKSNEKQTITGQVIFEKGLYSGKIKNDDGDCIEIKTYIDAGDNKAVTLTDDQTIEGKKYFEDGLYSGQIKDTNGNYIEIKTYIDDEIKLKENQLTELQKKIDSLTNAYADTRERVNSFVTFAEGHEF